MTIFRKVSGFWSSLPLTALLVISVMCNYLQFGYTYATRRTEQRRKASLMLSKGKLIDRAQMHRLDGGLEDVKFANVDRPTLLYIFSPSCGWCARNFNNLTVLATAAHAKYRLLGVSVDAAGLKEYVAKHQLPFETYYEPLGIPGELMRSGGTPQTAIIDTRGTVVEYWHGAYDPASQAEVEHVFGVKLPGLIQQ